MTLIELLVFLFNVGCMVAAYMIASHFDLAWYYCLALSPLGSWPAVAVGVLIWATSPARRFPPCGTCGRWDGRRGAGYRRVASHLTSDGRQGGEVYSCICGALHTYTWKPRAFLTTEDDGTTKAYHIWKGFRWVDARRK